MQYNGGPLITNVKIEGVYYSPWDTNPALQAQQHYMDQFFNYFTKSSYIDQLLTPFSVNAQVNNNGNIVPIPGTQTPEIIGHGTFIGNDFNQIQVPGNPNNPGGYGVLSDSSIQTMLENEYSKGNIPKPNFNTIYYVFAPPNTDVTAFGTDSINSFLGYHSNFVDANNNNFIYAVMPYPASPNNNLGSYIPSPATEPNDTLTTVASHEISEAITDPIGGSGWTDKQPFQENEIADKAVYVAPLFRMNDPFPNPASSPPSSNNYSVQQEWAHVDGPPQPVTTNGIYIPYLNYQATEGTYSGIVGSFVELDGVDTLPADFSVQVDWGDGATSTTSGSTTATMLTVNSVGNGTFTVRGTHTYSTALPEGESNNFLNMTVSDKIDGATATQDTQILIADASLTGTAVAVGGSEGQTLNGVVVGTFTDPGSNGSASDYIATITWDDGAGNQHTSTGTVVGTSNPQQFDILGSNAVAYAEEGPHLITTVVDDQGGLSATITSTANVSNLGVLVSAQAVSTTEGSTVKQVIGTFTDPGGNEPAGDYQATIAWGDGRTTAGSITFSNASGVFTVSGSHTYSEEINAPLTLSVQDDANLALGSVSTGTSATTFTANAGTLSAVDGFYLNEYAQFTSGALTGQSRQIIGYSGATRAFTLSSGLSQAPAPGDNFQIGANADLGSVNAGASATTFTANAGTLSAVDGFYLNEYAQFTSGILTGESRQITGYTVDVSGIATFTFASGFSAAAAAGDSFMIFLNGGPTAVAVVPANVAYAPLSVTAQTINPGEKGQFSGQVGTFTQTGANESPASYTATINWGDALPAPVLNAASLTAGGSLTAATTYFYELTATNALGETTASNEVSATPTTGNLTVSLSWATVNGAAGYHLYRGTSAGGENVLVATLGPATSYSDTGAATTAGSPPSANTSATGPGTISPASGGTFTVSGTHTYAEEGPYPLTLTVQNDPNRVSSSVASASSPTTFSANSGALSAVDNFYLNDYVLFTSGALTGQSRQISGYTGASDTFTFSGGFSAAPAPGDHFQIGGIPASSTNTITVNDLPLSVIPLSISTSEGTTFNAPLATFTDPGGINESTAESAAAYTATVAWGDGATTSYLPGQNITLGANGVFTVSGSHAYTEDGSQSATVTISHNAVDATATVPASIVDVPIAATGGATFTSTEGALSALQTVATFSDPGGNELPADYAATVNWGDGGTASPDVTTANVVFNSQTGQWDVTAAHLYAAEPTSPATYSISVSISHDLLAATTVTSQATVADAAVSPVGASATSAGFTFAATEGVPSAAQTVATFTDPAGAEATANYSAAINWGDALPAPVLNPASLTAGGSLTAATTYFYELTATNALGETTASNEVSATTSGGNLSVSLSWQAVSVATGYKLYRGAAAGAENVLLASLGAVTSYSDTGAATTTPASPPSANSTGATSLGTISLGADNTFTVQGSHTYAIDPTPAPIGISVVLRHLTAPSVTVNDVAQVTDQSVAASGGMTFSASEGVSFTSRAVATFTDPAGADSTTAYSATIAWGDGTTTSYVAGQNITLGAGGTFTVSGGHRYAVEGDLPIIVTIHHLPAADVVVSSVAQVIDQPVAPTGGFTFTATEGVVAASQVLATFTDPTGAPETSNDYAASINWGDGSTSPGTLSFDSTSGIFTVSSGHLYAEEGLYAGGTLPPITVTLSHDSAAVATVTAVAQVADTPLLPTGELTLSAVEGAASAVGTLVTFTDPGGNEPDANYTASINWGDGTSSLGTVGFDNVRREYTVSGAHTYAEQSPAGNPYQAIVSIQDGTSTAVSASSYIVVSDPLPAATGGLTLAATEGQLSAPQTVATFTDPGGAESFPDYGATIVWGDGTSSSGSISGPDANGVFTVSGAHSYAEEGAQNLQVVISHDTADSAAPAAITVSSQATIADLPVALIGNAATFTSTEGALSALQTVATFSDPGGAIEPLADYSAMVVWGDGQTSAGTIAFDAASGQFTVLGAHLYAEQGTPTITITLSHDSAAAATATSQANVADAPLLPNGGFTFTATEGVTSSSQTVASFADPGGNEPQADYSANINWGDGTSSAGSIGFDTVSGQFTVAGEHLYSQIGPPTGGPWRITATIQHESSPAATAVSQAAVIDQAVTATGGLTFTALEQVIQTIAEPVATFTDPGGAAPGGYSAQIAWGDGSTSQGTIVAPSGGAAAGTPYTVLGQHVYTAEGSEPITVTVLHGTAPNVTVSGTAQVADAQVIAQGGISLSATSGVPLTSQTVATFYDPVGADPLAVYSATINWGDGGTSAGSVSFDPASNRFTVSGDHVYQIGGQFTITVSIQHESAVATVTTSQAGVSGPPFAATPANITAIDGAPFNGIVATLSNATAAGLGVTIAWGDGTSSPGTVTGNLSLVEGSHVYHDEGSFPVTVTVVDAGVSLALSGTAAVAPATIPGVPNPTPNQLFIAEVYEDLLGRPVDPAGLAYWTAKLDAGTPRGDVSQQLAHTDEYFATIIRPAYQEFLLRQADSAGLLYWTHQMELGLSDEQLQAGFIGSPEYYNVRGEGANIGWLTAMYQDILNRAPDNGGLTYWLGQLALGETRTQVADGFTSSPEEEALWASQLYFHYLGRAPRPAETAQVVTEITQQGLSREDVIALTISTDEYFTRGQGA